MIGFEIPKIKPLVINDLPPSKKVTFEDRFPTPEQAMIEATAKQQTPVQGYTASIEDGPVKVPKESHVNVNEDFLITQVSRYIHLAHEVIKKNSDQIGWINRSAKAVDIAKMIQQETLFGNGLEY